MNIEKKQQVRRIFLYLSIILILIGLIVRISINTEKLDENNCRIEFTTNSAQGIKSPIPINISLNELYEGYLIDKCYVIWDHSQGFIKNG